MNYADLQAAVLADTKAVQHTDLIARKINAAVQYISRSGKYFHDLVEVLLDEAAGVDPKAYVQSISLPSRLRSASYLINSTCPGSKFQGYTVDDLASKPSALDVFYLSGTLLHIRHRILTPEFSFAYYSLPPELSADEDTNWITELAPELVIDYSAAMVLVQLGERETSKAITAFSKQNLQITMKDLVDVGGRVV